MFLEKCLRYSQFLPEKLTDDVHVRVVAGLAAVPVVGDQEPLPGGAWDLLVHRQQLDTSKEHRLQEIWSSN